MGMTNYKGIMRVSTGTSSAGRQAPSPPLFIHFTDCRYTLYVLPELTNYSVLLDYQVVLSGRTMAKRKKEKSPKKKQKNTQNLILTLSMCLIVKNEEFHLPNLLNSVKSIVDEIILVDTGSTDRTKEIGEEFGAKIFDFKWNNDFSAARNFSMDQATGDWILIMDADEVITKEDGDKLKSLLHFPPQIVYLMDTRNYLNEPFTPDWIRVIGEYPDEEKGFTGYIISRKIRLLPNDPNLRFQFPVHELISLTDCFRYNYNHKLFSVPIHHYGVTREKKPKWEEKNLMYLDIGIQKIKEEPSNPAAFYELGVEYGILGKPKEASENLERCLELNPNHKKAPTRLSKAYIQLGELKRAKECLMKGLETAENKTDVLTGLGFVHQKEEDWEGSIKFLDQAKILDNKSLVAFQLLSKAYFVLKNLDKSIEYSKKSLEIDPGFAPSNFFLGSVCFQQKNWNDSEAYLEKALEVDSNIVPAQAILGAAKLILKKEDEAIYHFEQVLQSRTEDVDSLANLAVVYAQRGEFENALGLLKKAHNLQPENQAVLRNLNQVKKELGK